MGNALPRRVMITYYIFAGLALIMLEIFNARGGFSAARAQHTFAFSGRFANGDILSGSVMIVGRGMPSFEGGPIVISGPQSLEFDEISWGNQVDTQTFRDQAFDSGARCLKFTFFIQTSDMRHFTGGPLDPRSGLTMCDGSFVPLVYGALTH